MHFVSVHAGRPFSSMDTGTTWKKSHFILSDKLDIHMINNLSIAFHTFASVAETYITEAREGKMFVYVLVDIQDLRGKFQQSDFEMTRHLHY